MKRALLMIAGVGLLSLNAIAEDEKPDVQAIYKKKCVMCHKADGKGYPSMKSPDFTSKEWQDSRKDEELIESVTKGKTPMPSFEKQLKPEEIQLLVTDVVRKFVEQEAK